MTVYDWGSVFHERAGSDAVRDASMTGSPSCRRPPRLLELRPGLTARCAPVASAVGGSGTVSGAEASPELARCIAKDKDGGPQA